MNKLFVLILIIFTVLSITAFILQIAYNDKCCQKETFSNIEKTRNNVNITAVILNYSRPHNVIKQVNKLGNNPYIKEIIIGHGNPKTYSKFKHKMTHVRNIKDYDNNKKYYALRRFLLALNARNNIILMLDDDYIPSDQYIDDLITQYMLDPDNFYGYYSRKCDNTGYHESYPGRGIAAVDTNIILTGVSFMGKHIIQNVWNDISASPYLHEIATINKGNGEDLLFNYHFQQRYKKNPVLVKGDVLHLDKSNGYHNQPGHYDIRNTLCKKFNLAGKNKIAKL